MSIEVRNLTHRYASVGGDGVLAVDDLSLTVEEGEWVAIIGHTGSGKSTFVRHLNGLTRPTSGEVQVEDYLVSAEGKPDLRGLRRMVGLVFQYPEQQLFEETVAREIAFGPKNWGVTGEELDRVVAQAMEMVGLGPEFAERNPFALSGGQKRRVAIASVLASGPKYLVLDEPTAGLDAQGRHDLLELLAGINARGVTLLQVTHDMDIAFGCASKILALEKGRKVFYATPQEGAAYLREHPVVGLKLPPLVELALALRDCGKNVPVTASSRAFLKGGFGLGS